MNIDLGGKTALVTAASKGIGLGVATALAGAGARVAISARDQARLDQALAQIADGPDSIAVAGDLGDPGFPAELVEEVNRRLGPIDVLVTNSGGPPAGDPLSFGEGEWSAAIEANMMSAIRLVNLVAPGMRERRWGRILHLTSMSAKEPDPGLVLSNVTRAALAAHSKTLARALAPDGVTVNTVLTGGVLTDRVRDLVAADVDEGADVDAQIEELGRTAIPAGRFATPEEFAQAVLFLASEEAWYVNGTAIPVDGAASHTTF